ncbi:single-stranded DNA-binding protein [[Mycoplasma] anseris]|uniref:Single-stranded DNA-binding protein n=1 Tax=[Mycoplasma] anseris TaxID=92400 RepID=A0A2Z4ND06_9BACT|nr:single-stranded DNA-binding protein [[Mycoplasma] anseris]AWX69448.1 single-stranded DNA-binding protein [[Mycoplasma] anseris]
MNKVIIVGRLSATPYQGFTNSNIEYSRFTVATRRTYNTANNEPITDFIPCVAWRQNAEFINKYLDKGSLVSIEGFVQSSRVTIADGSNINSFAISVDRIESLETKAMSENRRKNVQEFEIPSNTSHKEESNEIHDIDENIDSDFLDLEF